MLQASATRSGCRPVPSPSSVLDALPQRNSLPCREKSSSPSSFLQMHTSGSIMKLRTKGLPQAQSSLPTRQVGYEPPAFLLAIHRVRQLPCLLLLDRKFLEGRDMLSCSLQCPQHLAQCLAPVGPPETDQSPCLFGSSIATSHKPDKS